MNQGTALRTQISNKHVQPAKLPRSLNSIPTTCIPRHGSIKPNGIKFNASNCHQADQTTRRPLLCRAAYDSSMEAYSDPERASDDQLDRLLSRALLLTFFASQTRSLFAAKCFIETLIEAYRLGVTITDVKVAITLALLETGYNLPPIDQDVLLSWCSIVMMTLQTIEIPLYPQGEDRRQRRQTDDGTSDTGNMMMGLRGFVQNSIDRFLQGTTLVQLQLQQSMNSSVNFSSNTGNDDQEEDDPYINDPSPSVMILQMNTRLVITTLEVVKALGLPTVVRLDTPETAKSIDDGESSDDEAAIEAVLRPADAAFQLPVGFVSAFFGPSYSTPKDLSPTGSYESDGEGSAAADLRARAVRMLIGFTGASLGVLMNAQDFIDQAMLCYKRGWTAEQLFAQLQEEEFGQVGGVSRVRVASMPSSTALTVAMFARWISVVYMTLAIMGVEHPKARKTEGWAWIGLPDELGGNDAISAYKLADFVATTLASLEEDESKVGSSSEEDGVVNNSNSNDDDVVVEGSSRVPAGFGVGMEDSSLYETSSFALMMSQQLSLVNMTRMRARQWAAHNASTRA